VTKTGRLKYQHKPMEVHLENVKVSDRIHLVHYIVRDHCSGLFYAEMATSRNLLSIEQFLSRAWGKKSDYVFCGIPDLLTVPKTVEVVFPTAKSSVASLGVQFVEVTSGFQGGVRDIRTVEDWLKLACDIPIEIASLRAPQISEIMSRRKSRNGVDDKVSLWLKHPTPIRVPPERWGHEA
jgi:hypothetical protein